MDRAKMFTYVNCARFGVPCPITGSASVIEKSKSGSGEKNLPSFPRFCI